jgi:YfiH family protein
LTSEWTLEERDGLTFAVSGALSAVPGIGHAFSTRCADGGDRFDLGGALDVLPEFAARRRRLGMAASLDAVPAAPHQVHGTRLLDASLLAVDGLKPEADGIVADRREMPGVASAVRTADCVPILIADSAGKAAAAIHAGWRGTAAGIARSAVEELERRGFQASDLVVALGPAIGACCYEVGDEVLQAIEKGTGYRENGRNLDLRAVNARILRASGVLPGSISVAPWCTRCNPTLFYSHREDPVGAGRMLSCIGWTRPNAGVP